MKKIKGFIDKLTIVMGYLMVGLLSFAYVAESKSNYIMLIAILAWVAILGNIVDRSFKIARLNIRLEQKDEIIKNREVKLIKAQREV